MNTPPIRIDSVWLPKQSSTLAPEIDYGFAWAYWLSIIFFVGIVGAMFYFMVKYKRRTDKDRTEELDHSTSIEVIWSVVPLALVLVLFWIGFRGYLRASVAPANAMEIRVTAQMYNWNFEYPGGLNTVNELVVPKGKPVKLIMSSQDVLHSLYIPEFRVKQDAVPSLYTSLWFEATELGDTALECTEYCGVGHSDMLATVRVLEPDAFEKWAESQSGDSLPPEERGKKIYEQRCKSCHSIDGSRMAGPSFQGVWGRNEEIEGGPAVKVDENYVRESIYNPQAKIVKGYAPAMPTFKGLLKDKDIDGVIAYFKTLK
jgi:cytochrome c oxidase subunit 2